MSDNEVTTTGAAEILGVHRTYLAVLRRRPDFPVPLRQIGRNLIYWREEVEAYAAAQSLVNRPLMTQQAIRRGALIDVRTAFKGVTKRELLRSSLRGYRQCDVDAWAEEMAAHGMLTISKEPRGRVRYYPTEKLRTMQLSELPT